VNLAGGSFVDAVSEPPVPAFEAVSDFPLFALHAHSEKIKIITRKIVIERINILFLLID
jgi:hypothetical protein